MKQFYLILIAIFTLCSCSNDDNENNENSNQFDFTLEVSSNELLNAIKVEIVDEHLNPIETKLLTDTSSLTMDITQGYAFIVHGYDEAGFTASYTLWRNLNNTIILEGGLGCNVYCFKQENLN